jgi:DNA (cytosine-5)-methyltransferase 1
LGGNRLLWNDCEVTAIEMNTKIAGIYSDLFPEDTLVLDDAHKYLLENFQDFDFIWASPPCQSHSRMIRSGRNRKPRYVDLQLYEEIILLQNDFKGTWLVENVVPWYKPLITPSKKLGRHLFWSNLDLANLEEIKSPKGFISKQNLAAKAEMEKWLGFPPLPTVYYSGNHDPTQVLRNCIHPELGRQVLDLILYPE